MFPSIKIKKYIFVTFNYSVDRETAFFKISKSKYGKKMTTKANMNAIKQSLDEHARRHIKM